MLDKPTSPLNRRNDAVLEFENSWMLNKSTREPATSAIRRSLVAAAWFLFAITSASAEPVHVVVADRAYADLVETIAGSPISVAVVGSSIARGENAITFPPGSLVLCSGTRADAWLRDAASRAVAPVTVLDVYRPAEDHDSNIAFPWYDLPAIAVFSRTIANELAHREPAAASRVEANLNRLLGDFKAIKDRLDKVARDYAHSDVIVADDLSRDVARQLGFKALGLANRGQRGALPPTNLTSLQEAIQRHAGSIFLYDKDIPNPAIKRVIAAATDSGIPVVALQEKLPTGLHYQRWARRQWNTIHGALNEAAP